MFINFFSDCQDGWDYFPHTNKCYKHYGYSNIVTWMDAQNTCRQFGVSRRKCINSTILRGSPFKRGGTLISPWRNKIGGDP